MRAILLRFRSPALDVPRTFFRLLVAATAFACVSSAGWSAPKTVCTITVNSEDERETFRRHLPAGDYRFVELIERGRSDWLSSACRAGVSCDVLVISGHFDGGTQFYSDRLDVSESLPVEEMERAACSASCPGVFSHLKEVYLFGCNTLDPETIPTASSEIERSLVRAGRSQDDAARAARRLLDAHPQSNRDRMRNLFRGVPVIYGFTSKAPLGHVAGPILDRYLVSGGAAEVGSGRASSRLQRSFTGTSLTVASGTAEDEPQYRTVAQACRFTDERADTRAKVAFLHELLRGELPQFRLFLEPIAGLVKAFDPLSVTDTDALRAIRDDTDARRRFLEFARDADQPDIRAKMIDVAARLGWLTPEGKRAELADLMRERLVSPTLNAADIDLACSMNQAGELDLGSTPIEVAAGNVAQASVMACLGDPASRTAVLHAVTTGDAQDVAFVDAYLHHRPVATTDEFRGLAARVAEMRSPERQARALETLSRRPLADAESVALLTRSYASATSAEAQRSIASILIRSDYRSIEPSALLKTLLEHRIGSPDAHDMIDVLIRRLQLS